MTYHIRIDSDAKEKVDNLNEEIGGTKSGIASELIRRGYKDFMENE